MGARSFFTANSVFQLPSSIFQPFALIVSVGSGLARSRLALATGGRSYSIRRFGGLQLIEQILFRSKHSCSALLQRISKSVAVPILVFCPNPELTGRGAGR